MSATNNPTKTEQRVLQVIYRLQTQGLLDAGHLATYERLEEETLASRQGLLATCQRLVREGKLIRRRINASDREKWERGWPDDYARRQTHFKLSPATFAALERDPALEFFDDDDFKYPSGMSEPTNGGYRIPDD